MTNLMTNLGVRTSRGAALCYTDVGVKHGACEATH